MRVKNDKYIENNYNIFVVYFIHLIFYVIRSIISQNNATYCKWKNIYILLSSSRKDFENMLLLVVTEGQNFWNWKKLLDLNASYL